MLVDVRAVRGVHQADDGVVDVGVEILPIDEFGPSADDAGKGRRRMVRRRPARIGRHPDEHQTLALDGRITPHPNPIQIKGLAFDQRGNGGATAIGAKAPSVIGALHGLGSVGLAGELARRERRGAVRTDVAQGENLAAGAAAQENRLAQYHLPRQTSGLEVARHRGEIPDVGQEPAGESRWLGGGVRHGAILRIAPVRAQCRERVCGALTSSARGKMVR